jgi:hypothetical protein
VFAGDTTIQQHAPAPLLERAAVCLAIAALMPPTAVMVVNSTLAPVGGTGHLSNGSPRAAIPIVPT